MKNTVLCLLTVLVIVCNGCCSTTENAVTKKATAGKDAVKVITEQSEAELPGSANGKTDYDELRRKANVAEAASIVGYDGKAIKKDLNKIINESERMSKQLEDNF